MKYLFLSLLFFVNLALGFDSVEVSDKGITLHKYGYFTTSQELSPLEALRYTNNHPLLKLPKQAKSFGFDNHTYWFAFDVSTLENKRGILDVKNLVASSCELFVFENGKQIRHDKSGYNVIPDKRAINSLLLQFKLEAEKQNTIYLVKINSNNPHYAAFEFGNQEEITKKWNILIFTSIAAFAICVIMIFYNLALFFAIKDTTYLYYCLYIGSYLAFNISALGFLPTLSPFFTSIEPGVPVGVCLQIMYIGLTLFTIKFLQLDKNDPKLKKQLLYVLYFMLFSTFLIPINQGLKLLAVFSMAVLAFFLIYSVIKTYLKGYKPALFYLIATGIAIICNMLFMNMNQGGGIPYTIWTFNLVSFGLIWDMFFLSFAIAHRIRLLQEENLKNERLAIMKSRQKVIGELTGNIAHQWRQPLNALGAVLSKVEAKLKYESISHDELLLSCSSSSSILKNLSNTIDTLQDFFVNSSNTKEQFDVNKQIHTIIHFLQDTMRDQHINVLFNPEKTLIITSERNLLSQVVMNVFLNAKNILIERNKDKDKSIIITTDMHNHTAILTIQDNGGGIEVDPINKIFEPFVSTRPDGSGFGLYMAKNIIEKLGGEIAASNTKDGAKFTIKFPILKN